MSLNGAPDAVAAAGEDLLRLQEVEAGFGSNVVLHGVDLTVRRGEVNAILGLNGAGKSVTMKTIAGLIEARSGSIVLGGSDITSMPAEQRVALGMAHVPQGRQVFPELSVEENLRLGAYTLRRRDKSRYQGVLDSVFGRFPVLKNRSAQPAGSLSGGEQATLAVGRALMAEPKLILVDEASAGLSPVMAQEVFKVLREVNASGVTILMVEQNVTISLQYADRVNIMQSGQIVYSTPVGELDEERLTKALGVGRLLGSTVGAAAKARRKRA